MTLQSESKRPAPALLVQGLVFGVLFGFLLQKGGVAKYDVLVDALRLVDPTVFQVILAAVAVGLLGIQLLARTGLLEPQPKPTRYAANIVGGVIFGVGFGLSGYCPGTGAAAVGQGNLDAIFVVFGLIVGSFAYAELKEYLSGLEKVGDRGTLTLPAVLHARSRTVAFGLAAVLVLVLFVIGRYSAV